MLVLSRKNQESVVVGGSDGFQRLVKVTVLAIQGGRRETRLRCRYGCPRPPFGGVGPNPSRRPTIKGRVNKTELNSRILALCCTLNKQWEWLTTLHFVIRQILKCLGPFCSCS